MGSGSKTKPSSSVPWSAEKRMSSKESLVDQICGDPQKTKQGSVQEHHLAEEKSRSLAATAKKRDEDEVGEDYIRVAPEKD